MAKNIIAMFPTEFLLKTVKLAKVVPLFKSGTRLNPSDYNSLSLLSNFSKIFEKLLYINLNWFLINTMYLCWTIWFSSWLFNCLTIAKIGRSPSYSKWKKLATAAIFLDLKKAFDTVDHQILVKKFIMAYVIRGVVNNIFRSYLNNRKQFVFVNQERST